MVIGAALRSRRRSRLPLEPGTADHVAMVILALVIAAFALFELLAYRYGAESRPGFVERAPHDV
jgi:hypothetical protein